MLIQQFRYDNYRLHQLGNNSVFTLTLQAGLSAIKTPYPSLASSRALSPSITFVQWSCSLSASTPSQKQAPLPPACRPVLWSLCAETRAGCRWLGFSLVCGDPIETTLCLIPRCGQVSCMSVTSRPLGILTSWNFNHSDWFSRVTPGISGTMAGLSPRCPSQVLASVPEGAHRMPSRLGLDSSLPITES